MFWYPSCTIVCLFMWFLFCFLFIPGYMCNHLLTLFLSSFCSSLHCFFSKFLTFVFLFCCRFLLVSLPRFRQLASTLNSVFFCHRLFLMYILLCVICFALLLSFCWLVLDCFVFAFLLCKSDDYIHQFALDRSRFFGAVVCFVAFYLLFHIYCGPHTSWYHKISPYDHHWTL